MLPTVGRASSPDVRTRRLTWDDPAVTNPPAELSQSAFLKAARGEPVPHTPVWFMRQAGRALPEYRALRAGTAMLDACADPAMVTEITLQPVRRFGTEAVRALTAELGGTPLIGFAGAPFTLASYLVEGGPSKNHAATKVLMHA